MTHLEAIALLEKLRIQFGTVEMERGTTYITYWLAECPNLPSAPASLAKWSAGLGLRGGAVWGVDGKRGIFVRVER